MHNRHSATFKFDSFLGIILLVAFFVGIYFMLKGIFTVLSMVWVAVGLLALTLIIDRYVVINYVKWLWKSLLTKPLIGIAAIALTIIGYMVVIPFLFAKALFKKKVRNMTKQFQQQMGGHQQPPAKDEFVDFEEVSSEMHTEEPLELPRSKPRPQQPQQSRKGTDYDRFFEQ